MEKKILICGVNWLGDSVMSMPALLALKKSSPDSQITMLVKPRVAELWKMCPAVDKVINISPGLMGTFRTARKLKGLGYSQAFVFPNSFRSALIPWLAAIPERTGTAGHQRRRLLTETIGSDVEKDDRHQAMEYFDILGIPYPEGEADVPHLKVPQDAMDRVKSYMPMEGKNLAAIIPGAAFGPSKRWPAEHFIAVGRRISEFCKVLVLGSENENQLCAGVAEGIGDGAINLAGKTSLSDLVAILGVCRLVICNDSGGMHLAAAAGSKIVAIFGLTDPAKTGPLGHGHRVITDEKMDHSRDIKRDSLEAERALRSIYPDRVIEAAMEILES